MTASQNSKTYEVEFVTEAFRHIFYISCPDSVEAKTFAHAVFHYFDTPPEWGRKIAIRTIAEIKPASCLPDYLHVVCHGQQEVAMPDESEESHREVKELLRQIAANNLVPMAIYDDENKKMMVYATVRLEVAPQAGAISIAKSFSLFGDIQGRFRTGDK